MKEFLKWLYEDLYDLPHFYLGIENEFYCHVFSIVFLLMIFIGVVYIFKMVFDVKIIRKDKKKLRKSIDRLLISILGDKNKKNLKK